MGWTNADVDKMYTDRGYRLSANCDPECRKRKIAVFVKDGKPTHGALETADGDWWESKIGGNVRIMHRLKQLEGPEYGRLDRCFEKADPTANLARCPECIQERIREQERREREIRRRILGPGLEDPYDTIGLRRGERFRGGPGSSGSRVIDR